MDNRRLMMLVLVLLGGGVIVGMLIQQYTTPVQVTFAELISDPERYANRLIEVRGYWGNKGLCSDGGSGPPTNKVLLSSDRSSNFSARQSIDVQFDGRYAAGPHTVTGWLQRYDGSVDCGDPEKSQTVWYIEATAVRALVTRP